jgi:hypothetical protein
LDYRTFFGEPEEALAQFISDLPGQLDKDLNRFKELAESDTFKDEVETASTEVSA